MAIAMCLFDAVDAVKEAYDTYSTFKIKNSKLEIAKIKMDLKT